MNQIDPSLIKEIKELRPRVGSTVIITIDGPSGSGKTSLADQVREYLDDCTVINMDDLYRSWTNPFNGKLEADLIRILSEVQLSGRSTYLKFDWEKLVVGNLISFGPTKNLIIEGVGAGQRCTRNIADLALWIEAPKEIAFARVLARDGLEIAPLLTEFNLAADLHFELGGNRQAARIHLSGV